MPKLRFDGFAASAPGVTPVPDRLTFNVEFEALLATAMIPLMAPAEWGAKLALKVTLCPAANERGRLKPLTLKSDPLAVACEIVTLEPPALVRVSDFVRVLPRWTEPKLKLGELTVNDPGVPPFPFDVLPAPIPWQPSMAARASTANPKLTALPRQARSMTR